VLGSFRLAKKFCIFTKNSNSLG